MSDPSLQSMPHMPRAVLRGFERVSVPLLEAANRRPHVRQGLHFVSGWSFACVVRAATGPRWQLFGLEQLQQLDAPDGLILAANHRSFFDLYVISTVLKFHTKHLRQLAFPVRSEFFYTHPVGVGLNFTVAGATMWPPVFRDDRRRTLNPVGMEQLAHTLGRGCVIGIHPEGTRNKGADPYDYLPVKPGLGLLVAGCKPGVQVVPIHVAGLSNDPGTEFKRSLDNAARQAHPVRVRFGTPLRAGDLQQTADPVALTQRVFDQITALGEQDRAWMAGRGRP